MCAPAPRPTEDEIIEAVYAARNAAGRILRRFPNDVDDVMQNAALSAFLNADQFCGKSRLSTWATKIVINHSLMMLRHRVGREARSLDEPVDERDVDSVVLSDTIPSPEPLPDEIAHRNLVAERIAAAIADLPNCLRRAAFDQYTGYTCTEGATVNGTSLGSEKSYRFRARERLRVALADLAGPARAGAMSTGSPATIR